MQVFLVYDIFIKEMNLTLWCSGMWRLPTISILTPTWQGSMLPSNVHTSPQNHMAPHPQRL